MCGQPPAYNIILNKNCTSSRILGSADYGVKLKKRSIHRESWFLLNIDLMCACAVFGPRLTERYECSAARMLKNTCGQPISNNWFFQLGKQQH